MNYIQRLFAPSARADLGLSAPVAPLSAASSPVVAADQRIGLFPGLVDPFGLGPALPEADDPQSDGPAPDRRSQAPKITPPQAIPGTTQPSQRRNRQSTSHEEGRQTARSVPDPVAPPLPPSRQDRPGPRPASPLQRLVERDPLPGRHHDGASDPAGRIEQPAAPPTLPARPEPRVEATPGVTPAATQPAVPDPQSPPAIFQYPSAITPDQFQPRSGQTADAAPALRPVPASAPDPSPAPAEPVPAEAPTPAAPASLLRPATDDGPSPFARQVDIPPTPDTQAGWADAAKPAPERIIERIREVPIAPPAPPKAMTAGAQSVIGSLGQRRSNRWQPRQGGY